MKQLKRKIYAAWNILGAKAAYWIIIGIFSGCALSFVEVLLANFIQLFLHTVGMDLNFGGSGGAIFPFLSNIHFSLFSLMVFLGVIGVSRGMAMFSGKYASAVAQEIVGARLRLFSLQELLISENNQYVSAALINTRFGEIFPKTVLFFYHISQLIPQLIQVLILLGVLFYLSAISTGIALLGLALVGILLFFTHGRLRKAAGKVPGEQEALLVGIERITRNWLLVRAFRTNKMEFSNLSKNIMNYSLHSKRSHMYSAIGSVLPQTFGVFLLICIIVFSLSMNTLSQGVLISFLYLFLRLIQMLSTLIDSFSTLVMYSPQARLTVRYLESYDLEKNKQFGLLINNPLACINFDLKDEKEVWALDATPPAIELSNIFFRYAAESHYLFTNFEMFVAPGEQVAIIGGSGSGKSTLLAIIFGLLLPEKGTVTIHDLPASQFFSKFSDRIGYVGAEPFLIEGTIKENLDYGASSAYLPQEYDKVLRETSLSSMIAELPNGLSHKIKENGEGLSSGQKQRLSIARSLLRKPVLLILDEITSNLDIHTEKEIADTFAKIKGKSTVLMVSHRPGAICYADKIIDLSV